MLDAERLGQLADGAEARPLNADLDGTERRRSDPCPRGQFGSGEARPFTLIFEPCPRSRSRSVRAVVIGRWADIPEGYEDWGSRCLPGDPSGDRVQRAHTS